MPTRDLPPSSGFNFECTYANQFLSALVDFWDQAFTNLQTEKNKTKLTGFYLLFIFCEALSQRQVSYFATQSSA